MIRNLHAFNVNTHYQMKANQFAIRFVTASSISSLFVSVIFLTANIFARLVMEHIGKVAFHAYLEYTYVSFDLFTPTILLVGLYNLEF